jgi:trans-2,3-dihydro-3-hydroxyanthranilate isomerase
MNVKQIRVYHIDAFSKNPFAGNPAGVVPDASDLTVNQMQRIANELHLPESAFLQPSTNPKANFRVLFHTTGRNQFLWSRYSRICLAAGNGVWMG